MKLVKVTLYSQHDKSLKPLNLIGVRSNPSVAAKNWYQLSSNAQLGWFVYLRCPLSKLRGYDSIRFTDNRTMRILRADQVAMHKIKLEVSV